MQSVHWVAEAEVLASLSSEGVLHLAPTVAVGGFRPVIVAELATHEGALCSRMSFEDDSGLSRLPRTPPTAQILTEISAPLPAPNHPPTLSYKRNSRPVSSLPGRPLCGLNQAAKRRTPPCGPPFTDCRSTDSLVTIECVFAVPGAFSFINDSATDGLKLTVSSISS